MEHVTARLKGEYFWPNGNRTVYTTDRYSLPGYMVAYTFDNKHFYQTGECDKVEEAILFDFGPGKNPTWFFMPVIKLAN